MVLETIKKSINEHSLIKDDNHVILMVSGGSDSVGMTYAMSRILPAEQLHIVSLDHQLRKVEGWNDLQFVNNLADRLGIKFYPFSININKLASKLTGDFKNIENLSRICRYFIALLTAYNISKKNHIDLARIKIATAHTLNDRAENFFMRSIVGTGSGNLSSIKHSSELCLSEIASEEFLNAITTENRDKEVFNNKFEVENDIKRKTHEKACNELIYSIDEEWLKDIKKSGFWNKEIKVIRPVLNVTKQNLQNFIIRITGKTGNDTYNLHKTNGGNKNSLWREDKTNGDTDRFRAFVRNEIMPRAISQNENMLYNLATTMDIIAVEDKYMNKVCKQALKEHTKKSIDKFDNIQYKLQPSFGSLDLAIANRCIYEILKEMLGLNARIENATIKQIADAFENIGTSLAVCKSGYTVNIQGNLAVHSNNKGVTIQPMEAYRKSRNRL